MNKVDKHKHLFLKTFNKGFGAMGALQKKRAHNFEVLRLAKKALAFYASGELTFDDRGATAREALEAIEEMLEGGTE